MKFNNLIKQAMSLYEADATMPSPDAALPGAQGNVPPTPQSAPNVQVPNLEPKRNDLSSENKVMLVRLLLKTFVATPDPEDIDKLETIGDINESNVNDQLAKILKIVKPYIESMDTMADDSV